MILLEVSHRLLRRQVCWTPVVPPNAQEGDRRPCYCSKTLESFMQAYPLVGTFIGSYRSEGHYEALSVFKGHAGSLALIRP